MNPFETSEYFLRLRVAFDIKLRVSNVKEAALKLNLSEEEISNFLVELSGRRMFINQNLSNWPKNPYRAIFNRRTVRLIPKDEILALRRYIVKEYLQGLESHEVIAKRFGVSRPTLQRWIDEVVSIEEANEWNKIAIENLPKIASRGGKNARSGYRNIHGLSNKSGLSLEERIKIVEMFYSGKLSSDDLRKKYFIYQKTIAKWVEKFSKCGLLDVGHLQSLARATINDPSSSKDEVKRSRCRLARKGKTNSLDIKREVVVSYMLNPLLWKEIALKFGCSRSTIFSWYHKLRKDPVVCERLAKLGHKNGCLKAIHPSQILTDENKLDVVSFRIVNPKLQEIILEELSISSGSLRIWEKDLIQKGLLTDQQIKYWRILRIQERMRRTKMSTAEKLQAGSSDVEEKQKEEPRKKIVVELARKLKTLHLYYNQLAPNSSLVTKPIIRAWTRELLEAGIITDEQVREWQKALRSSIALRSQNQEVESI